jgi:hypothetical protein
MLSEPDSDIEKLGGGHLVVPARACNTSMQQNPDLTVPTCSRTLAASRNWLVGARLKQAERADGESGSGRRGDRE